jgi:hypothetical protein
MKLLELGHEPEVEYVTVYTFGNEEERSINPVFPSILIPPGALTNEPPVNPEIGGVGSELFEQ